jgi:hypothetical protein
LDVGDLVFVGAAGVDLSGGGADGAAKHGVTPPEKATLTAKYIPMRLRSGQMLNKCAMLLITRILQNNRKTFIKTTATLISCISLRSNVKSLPRLAPSANLCSLMIDSCSQLWQNNYTSFL